MVGAYRAAMESLFPICTRKKQAAFPFKLLFANKNLMEDAVNPLTLKGNFLMNGISRFSKWTKLHLTAHLNLV